MPAIESLVLAGEQPAKAAATGLEEGENRMHSNGT